MKGLKAAFGEAFRTKRRIVAVLIVSALAWIAFVLLTRPIYAAQLLSASPAYVFEALSLLVWNQQANAGILGMILPLALAALIGTTIVVTGASLLQNIQSGGPLSGTIGSIVGFAGAGCASCGAGVLALLGISGGVALLPFEGLGIQLASIALLVGALEYNGRKMGTCTVSLAE